MAVGHANSHTTEMTLYCFLQLEYGEETWLAMLEHVGHRNTVFRTHHIYPDSLMMKLAEAAVTLVANGSTKQDFLRFFGRCFVRYFSHYGYEKFIKVSTPQKSGLFSLR